MKTLGKTPKKLTDYTREDYNRILNKKQPSKKGDGLYNNALNSRKYNVADREREKEGLYKPQMADHSREVSPAIRSYMKKKGITDVDEAKRRYAKGEALVKKQQAEAKRKLDADSRVAAMKKSQSDMIRNHITEMNNDTISKGKMTGRGPSLSSGISASSTALKRPAQKIIVDAKTKKSMEKDIKKTTRQANRAQRRYENTSSNKVAAKQRAKAQNLRASLATKKEAYSHVAKKGGKLCKKC